MKTGKEVRCGKIFKLCMYLFYFIVEIWLIYNTVLGSDVEQSDLYIYTHTHTYIHIYMCVCMYVCIYIYINHFVLYQKLIHTHKEKAMAPHSSTSCLENPMDGGAW